MHTYRKAKDQWLWTVGVWIDDNGSSCWEPIKDFNYEQNAAAFCSYLNGGERPAAVDWDK